MCRWSRLSAPLCALPWVVIATLVAADPPSSDRGLPRPAPRVTAAASGGAAKTYVPVHVKFRTVSDCQRVCDQLKPPFVVFLQAGEFADLLLEVEPKQSDYRIVEQQVKQFFDQPDKKDTWEAHETDELIVVPPP